MIRGRPTTNQDEDAEADGGENVFVVLRILFAGLVTTRRKTGRNKDTTRFQSTNFQNDDTENLIEGSRTTRPSYMYGLVVLVIVVHSQIRSIILEVNRFELLEHSEFVPSNTIVACPVKQEMNSRESRYRESHKDPYTHKVV